MGPAESKSHSRARQQIDLWIVGLWRRSSLWSSYCKLRRESVEHLSEVWRDKGDERKNLTTRTMKKERFYLPARPLNDCVRLRSNRLHIRSASICGLFFSVAQRERMWPAVVLTTRLPEPWSTWMNTMICQLEVSVSRTRVANACLAPGPPGLRSLEHASCQPCGIQAFQMSSSFSIYCWCDR